MIGYIEGAIRTLEPERVVVMAGGVGYLVNIPLSTYYKLEGTTVAALLIYTHVREDALALYGFGTADEKAAFEKLISISGIGPRLAQVILSGISTEDLAEAVMRGDSRRLSLIPGVGKKTSERICLELRDKLVLPGGRAAEPQARRPAALDDDVVSALVNLGYKAAVAQPAVAAAHKEIEGEAEFPILLRTALRRLTRRG
jgi:Holliday junction DNA helicase RuvA